MKNNEIIAERLKYLRKQKHVTQKELATSIRISYQSIVDYENCRREPAGRALAALERYFGVSGPYIMGLTDSPVPYITNTPLPDEIKALLEPLPPVKSSIKLISAKEPDNTQRGDEWKQGLFAGCLLLAVAILILAFSIWGA